MLFDVSMECGFVINLISGVILVVGYLWVINCLCVFVGFGVLWIRVMILLILVIVRVRLMMMCVWLWVLFSLNLVWWVIIFLWKCRKILMILCVFSNCG